MTARPPSPLDPSGRQPAPAPVASRLLRKLVPDALGLFRLASAPVLVWLLLRQDHATAFWLFVAAGLTDALDGVLARRLHVVDRFGTLLDPVADKAVMAAVYVTAALTGLLPWWLSGLVVGRDVIILSSGLLLLRRGRGARIRPLRISKTNTGLQIAYAALVLLVAGYDIALAPGWLLAGAVLVALTTVWSGVAYARAMRAACRDGGSDAHAGE